MLAFTSSPFVLNIEKNPIEFLGRDCTDSNKDKFLRKIPEGVSIHDHSKRI